MKNSFYQVESSVYFGILISSPLTGIFVVKSANPKTSIIFGSLICSLISFLTPLLGSSLFGFMWARGIFGVGFGMIFVSFFHLFSFWIPKQEYTRTVAFLATSRYAGMMLSDLWTDVFTKLYSWQATFYWFSVVPLLFLPFWAYVVRRSPSDHSTITASELNFLIANASPPEPQCLFFSLFFFIPLIFLTNFCFTKK